MVRCRPNSRSTWPFTPLGAIDQDIEQLEPRLILFVSLAGRAVDDEAALQHARRGLRTSLRKRVGAIWPGVGFVLNTCKLDAHHSRSKPFTRDQAQTVGGKRISDRHAKLLDNRRPAT